MKVRTRRCRGSVANQASLLHCSYNHSYQQLKGDRHLWLLYRRRPAGLTSSQTETLQRTM